MHVGVTTPPRWVYPYLVGVCPTPSGRVITPLALFPPPLTKNCIQVLVIRGHFTLGFLQSNKEPPSQSLQTADVSIWRSAVLVCHTVNTLALPLRVSEVGRKRKVSGLTTNASTIPGMGLDLEYVGLN